MVSFTLLRLHSQYPLDKRLGGPHREKKQILRFLGMELRLLGCHYIDWANPHPTHKERQFSPSRTYCIQNEAIHSLTRTQIDVFAAIPGFRLRALGGVVEEGASSHLPGFIRVAALWTLEASGVSGDLNGAMVQHLLIWSSGYTRNGRFD
jgi:hypothetical protein